MTSEGVLGKPRPSGRGGVTAEFFVGGIPRPQGSKSVSRTGHLYESSKGLKTWRATVTMTAKAWRAKQWGSRSHALGLDGAPLEAALSFHLPQPKRTRFQRRPAGRPDLDKLCRAVFDGLTVAQIIVDDARIVRLTATKEWAPQAQAGCLVRLGVMES